VRPPAPAPGHHRITAVEEGVDDVLLAFVAALQLVEGVVPGVRPFDVPSLPGLDRGLVALVGDLPGHAASGELVAGFLEGQVEENFGRHPDAEIYRSQPGMGAVLGARVLGEFGDDPHRYADGKARRNYAATSPITRASGKKKVVAARFIHNDRLVDALNSQAFASLNASPGARALYDDLRARDIEHNDALRRLASRLVGILHGCLKTRTLYDEATAWSHREKISQSDVAA
jgi:transposase IS116/IS110/IS902 family protein